MLTPVPQLLGQSWKTYRQHFMALKPYILLLFLPTVVLSLSGVLGITLSALLPVSDTLVTIVIVLLSLAAWIFSIIMSLAVALALKQALETGTVPAWREALHKVAPYLASIIWVWILVGLIVLGGVILLIIPALIFTVWYVFSSYAVLFEGLRGWAALKASKNLVSGRWFAIAWRVFAPGIVFGFLIGVGSLLVSLPFLVLEPTTVLAETGPSLTVVGLETLRSLLSALVTAVLSPLATLPVLLLYLEVKKTPVEVLPSALIS